MNDAETRFLDVLYDGVTDGNELQGAVERIQEMFSCRAAALLWIDVQKPEINFARISGVFNECGRLYLEQFAAIDPAPEVFARLPAGTASSTDRLLTPQQRHSHPFVQEFFRPIGLVETLGGTLFSDQARFSLIGLQRGNDRAQFDDDDIAKLERLMPHIARALQMRRAFFSLEAKNLGFQAAMDRLPAGVVMLDSDGVAMFVNAAMRAIARRADGLALDRAGRPLPLNLAARRRLDALLDNVAKGGSGGILAVKRAAGMRDYVMLVAPSPSSLARFEWDRRGHIGAIVLVHDPAARTKDAAEILQHGLHLPKGAAKLTAALAGADDLQSFAEREGITIHTARFHLRTALQRTGARTQAELVRLAMRLLRDVALAERGD
jgi:PAS domain-containing protein